MSQLSTINEQKTGAVRQVIVKNSNGVKSFHFPLFSEFPGVSHGFFSIQGGVSRGAFSGLNVGLSCGDSRGDVMVNREAVRESIGAETLVAVNQVHGGDLFVVRGKDVHGGAVEADAMATDLAGVALMIQTADCQPVIVFDPVKRVVANIHSGWRGSIENIVGRTIGAMVEAYGCNPHDMIAGIGPSLCPACCEFIHYKREIPEIFWKYKDENDCFDFWAVSADQLQGTGVRKENIEAAGLCTKCNPDLFFSYRRDRVTGRLANIICLR